MRQSLRQGLSFVEVLTECVRRNMTFAELLAIPEDDTWVYSDGISASCVGLAMRVWKAAGLFGALTPHINAGEFTVSSVGHGLQRLNRFWPCARRRFKQLQKGKTTRQISSLVPCTRCNCPQLGVLHGTRELICCRLLTFLFSNAAPHSGAAAPCSTVLTCTL